jgi:transketolase
MRTAFIETLIEAARRDDDIFLLNADLGFSVLEPFAAEFPDRYLNVGVAEQNLIGVAAGLALSGFKVFVYSIGNFPTQRCLEQIRVDVCYHEAHVVVAAVGGGFSYGAQGYTHHAIEDFAVMRALPGMRVMAPGDPHETRALTRHLAEIPGPGYIRLGRAGEPVVHAAPLAAPPLTPIRMREGSDVVLLSTGGILTEAVVAADRLAEGGIGVRLLSVPVLKPLDAAAVLDAISGFALVATIEEHSEIGGLRDTIAPLLAMRGTGARLLPFAVGDGATRGVILSQEAMRAHCGIDAASIAAGIRAAIGV